MQTATLAQLRQAAWEESAHAGVNRALGGHVAPEGMSIIDNGETKGRAYLVLPETSESLVQRLNVATIGSAGHLAVMAAVAASPDAFDIDPDPPPLDKLRSALASPLRMLGAANGAHSDQERVEHEADSEFPTADERSAFLALARARARRLIAQPRVRGAIESLAEVLLEHQQLSAEEAESAMRRGEAMSDLPKPKEARQ